MLKIGLGGKNFTLTDDELTGMLDKVVILKICSGSECLDSDSTDGFTQEKSCKYYTPGVFIFFF